MACSGFDPELPMFGEPLREPDLGPLRFLRWLAEHGRLEHAPLCEPCGECAEQTARGEPLYGSAC